MSASAWHGCSSFGERVDHRQLRRRIGDLRAAAPGRRCGSRRALTHRSRLRATSSSGSRSACITSAGISTMSPPSSRTPIVKVTRVRSDGFSNSSADMPSGKRPEQSAPAGPSARSRLSRVARSMSLPQFGGREVQDREEVCAPRVLCPILRVDLHVLGREVACPHVAVTAARCPDRLRSQGPCPSGTRPPEARVRRTAGRARTAPA